tara:strand:+ start:220 stop:498 length:279 start_codon:yes stop_codon:yes gene_type:complete
MKTQTNTIMKTTFGMKPAINIAEAKTSIHDVIDNNPLFLNKVTSILFIMLSQLDKEKRTWLLDKTPDQEVRDLYIEIRQQYEYFEEVTKYNF